jgi:hypothetical protein
VLRAEIGATHHCLWVENLHDAHILDLFGREQTKLDLLDGLERRARIGELKISHGCGCSVVARFRMSSDGQRTPFDGGYSCGCRFRELNTAAQGQAFLHVYHHPKHHCEHSGLAILLSSGSHSAQYAIYRCAEMAQRARCLAGCRRSGEGRLDVEAAAKGRGGTARVAKAIPWAGRGVSERRVRLVAPALRCELMEAVGGVELMEDGGVAAQFACAHHSFHEVPGTSRPYVSKSLTCTVLMLVAATTASRG